MPIRPTRPDDLDDLRRLYRELFKFEQAHCDPYMDLNFPDSSGGTNYLKHVSKNTRGRAGFVFEEDGVVKGYASLRAIPCEEYAHRINIRPLQLQTLIVDEKYRRQGIGRALVEYCKNVAKENHFTHFRVSSLAKNEMAKDFYKSCEFDEYEVMYEMEL